MSAAVRMRAEWQDWPGRGPMVSLGSEEIDWLVEEARQSAGVLLGGGEVKHGLVCSNYRPQTPVK